MEENTSKSAGEILHSANPSSIHFRKGTGVSSEWRKPNGRRKPLDQTTRITTTGKGAGSDLLPQLFYSLLYTDVVH